MKSFLFPILLLIISVFAQCKKSDTSPAPATGKDTIIIESPAASVFEKDISGMTWTTVGSSSNGYLQLTISAPQVLTKGALDSNTALVYVYTSDFSGSDWALVPYHTERNINVTATVAVGSLTITKQQDGKPYTQSWQNKVRVVLVPISQPGALHKG